LVPMPIRTATQRCPDFPHQLFSHTFPTGSDLNVSKLNRSWVESRV
jgi:hypothetical protein